jgi:hypothetical protein
VGWIIGSIIVLMALFLVVVLVLSLREASKR